VAAGPRFLRAAARRKAADLVPKLIQAMAG
jgi:hypothetical protein